MTTPPNDDSDLRGLFDDAVSGVHPEGGTDAVRARAGRPARRPAGCRSPSPPRWRPSP